MAKEVKFPWHLRGLQEASDFKYTPKPDEEQTPDIEEYYSNRVPDAKLSLTMG